VFSSSFSLPTLALLNRWTLLLRLEFMLICLQERKQKPSRVVVLWAWLQRWRLRSRYDASFSLITPPRSKYTTLMQAVLTKIDLSRICTAGTDACSSPPLLPHVFGRPQLWRCNCPVVLEGPCFSCTNRTEFHFQNRKAVACFAAARPCPA